MNVMSLLSIYFSHGEKEHNTPTSLQALALATLAPPMRYKKLGLWRFVDFEHSTSLKLLAQALGIPSPKEDIVGGMVRDMFYEANDLERIT